MKGCRRVWGVALGMIFTALLPGCAATPEIKLYLLSGMETSGPSAQGAGETPVIGLGPVTLPDYLDRPQIVFRVSENRLEAADFHRWAEPLAGNVAAVLAENLSGEFPASRIRSYPWQQSEAPGYRVVVDVLRFDAGPDDAVHLLANWSVTGREDAAGTAPHHADITVPTSTHHFEDLVRAESEALLYLSREIADELRRLISWPGR